MTTNLVSTNSTVTNTIATNITASNTFITNLTTSNLISNSLLSTNTTISNLQVTTAITAASAQITNTNLTNATISSAVVSKLNSLGNSNTIGNVFTTGGNVGIGINTPGYRLDVNGNVHVQANLYVDGLISGGTGTSSTFAYLTLTSTDDSINLSTGSLLTYGGITIQSPTDAESVTNGGSFLTDGGASIGKTLYVGQKIITDLVSASNLQTDNVTIGSLLATNVNLGIFSMFSGSFIPTNSNVSPSNVTGLMFDNTYIRSFTVTLSANITATTSLYETFVLEGVQLDSGWDLYVSSYGDSTDITFSITNSGNIQYTTPNYPGFINAIFRFQVSQINKTGSYSYPGIGVTQATLIANTLQLLNTQDSVSGVNNGSLYVMGGCTISKAMFSNNITTGDETKGLILELPRRAAHGARV